MAITIGKDVVTSLPGIQNDNIISVTDSSEAETIDISARGNAGFKSFDVAYTNRTVEVECLAHACTVGTMGSWDVTSIVTNEPLDGPVTYNITFKPTTPA